MITGPSSNHVQEVVVSIKSGYGRQHTTGQYNMPWSSEFNKHCVKLDCATTDIRIQISQPSIKLPGQTTPELTEEH